MKSESISNEQRADYRNQIKSIDGEIDRLRAEELNALTDGSQPIPIPVSAGPFDASKIPAHQLNYEANKRRSIISKAKAKIKTLNTATQSDKIAFHSAKIQKLTNEIDAITKLIADIH
jgi:hypothetical protein